MDLLYMRENGMDSPYLFLHCGFSIVPSLAHLLRNAHKGRAHPCGTSALAPKRPRQSVSAVANIWTSTLITLPRSCCSCGVAL